MPSLTVVVNQVATRDQTGASDEFIELLNISVAPQPIGNSQLLACNTNGTEVLLATIPAQTVMQPRGQVGQFFLVANDDGYSAATAPDLTYSGVDIQDLGGVRLVNAVGLEIDAVAFTDNLECTEGCPAVPQTEAEDPQNLANRRQPDGTDTDANCVDFKKLPRNPRNRFSLS